MRKEIAELLEISRFYGADKDYTLGGGGNTSYKDDLYLYIKASGYSLENITENGFAILERQKLSRIMAKKYSTDPQKREKEIAKDLMATIAEGKEKLKPSVEASLHDLIDFKFVVHTHPYLINALLCSKEVESYINDLFGDEILYIPYTDPGYILSKSVQRHLEDYRNQQGKEPNIIFLQNHGVFVAADNIENVKGYYAYIKTKLLERTNGIIKIEPIDYQGPIDKIITILSGMMEEELHSTFAFNTLIAHFTKDWESISRIDRPFIPDHIVYCKAYPMVLAVSEDQVIQPEAIQKSLNTYRKETGYSPKIIILEKGPVISFDISDNSAQLALDVFIDAMKISFYSNYFGGPHFMSQEQIRFIENWEAENYRRKISTGN
jgi:rhamnose utilization protein RhaD (predicted bifunctional aldolase and dehydrogenase)